MISRRSRGHVFGGSHPTDLPITQENFPALLQGYTLASLQSDGLHDVLGNNVITSSTGWLYYNNAAQFVSAGDLTAVGFAGQDGGSIGFTGTLRGFGTKNGVCILIGLNISSMVSATFKLGPSTTGPSFGYIPTPQSNSCRLDASNYCVPNSIVLLGSSRGHVITMDKTVGNGACYYDGYADSSGLVKSAGNGTLTGNITGSWPNFSTAGAVPTDDAGSGPAGGYVTGIFYFAFNNKPDRDLLNDAMMWMKDNPGKIYPGLARRQ